MVDQVELRSSQTPDVDLSSSRQRWESRIRDVLDRKWTGKRADAILAAMQSFKESLDHDIPSFHNMCATKLLQSMCRIDTTNLSSGFRQYLNDCFEKSHLNSPVGDLQDLISHGQYFEAMQKIHKYIPVRKNKKTSTRQQDLGLEGDLVRCWNASFHGNALQNLKKKFQYEHQMFVDKTNISPYAQTFDIIQSSGMGKSRVVEELAKEIFSIIFYLRKTAHESGFPAGDPEIYMFLMQPINLETTTTTKQKSMKDEEVSNNQIRAENLRAVSFFAGLFSTINTWLDKNVDIKGNELIELWHQYISPVSSDSDFQGKDNEDLGTAPFSNDHREGNYETTVNFGDEDESDTYESDVDNSANPTDSQGLWQRTRRREDFCRRVANKAETILSELAESLPRGWTTKELYVSA
ncbi:hypothetical protein BDD12DRAFT_275668 [Trichophaea hybrida]|nr:hypothetical protein BDD12DRAFT_275668 [Trichophaea hybrida]